MSHLMSRRNCGKSITAPSLLSPVISATCLSRVSCHCGVIEQPRERMRRRRPSRGRLSFAPSGFASSGMSSGSPSNSASFVFFTHMRKIVRNSSVSASENLRSLWIVSRSSCSSRSRSDFMTRISWTKGQKRTSSSPSSPVCPRSSTSASMDFCLAVWSFFISDTCCSLDVTCHPNSLRMTSSSFTSMLPLWSASNLSKRSLKHWISMSVQPAFRRSSLTRIDRQKSQMPTTRSKSSSSMPSSCRLSGTLYSRSASTCLR
mmetsp:Transcript_22838/g.67971  ORF Transcript_22838/g.67971 Transcript_22838/m.67971 type:complete len:260 (-) Transcript_22838:1679-2458(-)